MQEVPEKDLTETLKRTKDMKTQTGKKGRRQLLKSNQLEKDHIPLQDDFCLIELFF